VIEPLLTAPAAGGRVVWTGRYPDRMVGGLDGWNCSGTRLRTLLDDASELVVLDTLSFPWDSLSPGDLDVPFVAVVPDDLDDDAIDAVLKPSLLGNVTPFDRLVVGDSERRDRLQARWGLHPGTWIISPSGSHDDVHSAWAERSTATAPRDQPDGRVRTRKAVWRQHRQLVADSVNAALDGMPYGDARVSILGADEALVRAVARDCRVAVSNTGSEDAGGEGVDHVAVLVVPRATSGERVDALRRCHRRVRHRGVLVVVATVVVAPGDDPRLVPSVSVLTEELNLATGLAIHVDDIRSVRWAGEPFVRGVAISATSLTEEASA
jgi:hypothetical protein